MSSLIQKKKAIDQQEQHNHLNVRVRASDMRLALQNRAFTCARDNLDSMTGKKLDSKKLALALKKVIKIVSLNFSIPIFDFCDFIGFALFVDVLCLG